MAGTIPIWRKMGSNQAGTFNYRTLLHFHNRMNLNENRLGAFINKINSIEHGRPELKVDITL